MPKLEFFDSEGDNYEASKTFSLKRKIPHFEVGAYMKVLVTGGAGFIGSHLVDRLMEEGYKVRVVDNLSAGRLENLSRWRGNANFEFIKGDLRKANVASQAVNGIDVVFHLAANPEVRIGSQKPGEIYENNMTVTYNLLEAMRTVSYTHLTLPTN